MNQYRLSWFISATMVISWFLHAAMVTADTVSRVLFPPVVNGSLLAPRPVTSSLTLTGTVVGNQE